MHDSYTSDKLANPHQHVEFEDSYIARKGYRECKICHEFYVNLDSPSTRRAQDKLLDFVNDPENLKKAVEGSMEKRQEIINQASDQTNKEIEAILTIGFLYGIQSDFLPKEEIAHRVAGYKNTAGYKESRVVLLQLLNETVDTKMAGFGLKKGIEYKVQATDSVIVLTPKENK